MGLFSFGKRPKKVKLTVTDNDRIWVEENFNWLVEVYGKPQSSAGEFTLSKEFFPKTLETEELKIEGIISDLCYLLDLDTNKISFELIKDIRDNYAMPYAIEGVPFESDTEILEQTSGLYANALPDKKYKIYLANILLVHHRRLIFCLINECIKIRLAENNLKYDTGEDTELFIHLASIFFGFGVIIGQNLYDHGVANDGFWETKWNYSSVMPIEIMGYGLAYHSRLIEDCELVWMKELPSELVKQVETTFKYFNEQGKE